MLSETNVRQTIHTPAYTDKNGGQWQQSVKWSQLFASVQVGWRLSDAGRALTYGIAASVGGTKADSGS